MAVVGFILAALLACMAAAMALCCLWLLLVFGRDNRGLFIMLTSAAAAAALFTLCYAYAPFTITYAP